MTSSPPPFTSLRKRFLIALALVVGAILILALFIRYPVTAALLKEENRHANQELDRLQRALQGEMDDLRRTVEDWAWWDDTYAFVHGQRPGYVDSNLYRDTLENIDLRLMAYLRPDGSPYWTAGIDDDSHFWSCAGPPEACDGSPTFIDELGSRIEEGLAARTHTWLWAGDTPALIALSPIRPSQRAAPARGWLAMVYPLAERQVAQLSETTGMVVSLRYQPALGTTGEDRLERLSPDHMLASRSLPALPAGRSLRLEARLPRQRYQADLATFRFALVWTAVVLGVTLTVALLLLERMILRPLRDFTRFTQRLGPHDPERQTPDALIRRPDEIGILARAFHRLRQRQSHQHELLLELSRQDALTGLANRRRLDEHLADALAQSAQGRQGVTLLMIDIDHFKAYNDHFGHPAGDACLKTVADTMRQHFGRSGQLVARTGGEEFTVVLPGAPEQAGVRAAEGLRAAIERLAIPHPHAHACVTISVGVSHVAPHETRSAESLIAGADAALYEAKRAGRNRIEVETTRDAMRG